MVAGAVTNRLGVHALVWVGGWTEKAARRAVASPAVAGVVDVELPALDPSGIVPGLTARLLEEHGLSPAVSSGLDYSAGEAAQDPEAVAAGRRRLVLAVSRVRDV